MKKIDLYIEHKEYYINDKTEEYCKQKYKIPDRIDFSFDYPFYIIVTFSDGSKEKFVRAK